MNLESGLQIERPNAFVPWSTTRDTLRELFPLAGLGRQGLKEVTANYLVLSDVVSLGGLLHELGFHFGRRGHLAKFEYFRKSDQDLRDSYAEFQQHLEMTFGPPTRREPGDEGFDRCVWEQAGAKVFHELVDRFGPEEHVWIVRSRRRWVGRRAAAYVLDIVLLFAVLGPLGFLTQWMLGFSPATGQQIWVTLLLNFSLPAWTYFTVADASAGGATLGKRWLGLRVSRIDHGRLGVRQALGRTAVKLLPWELVHVSAFALAQDMGEFSLWQGVGMTVANALAITYLVWAVVTRGRQSVHDVVAGTVVRTIRTAATP